MGSAVIGEHARPTTAARRRGVVSRLAGNLASALLLARSGVSWRSILLYPVRRRLLNRRSQIDLRSGLSFEAPPNEPLVFLFREIWAEDCYRVADLRVGAGEAIVDIGAHVGLFSVWAAARYPSARVIAVEPSPLARAYLLRNVARNHLSNVAVVPLACGGQRGTARLYSRGPEMMATLYPPPQATPGTVVEMAPLEEIFQRHAVRGCGLLKLDCEGAEYDILLGAPAATLGRIGRITMECHVGVPSHRPEDVAAHLLSHGFAVQLAPAIDGEHVYLYAQRSS